MFADRQSNFDAHLREESGAYACAADLLTREELRDRTFEKIYFSFANS